MKKYCLMIVSVVLVVFFVSGCKPNISNSRIVTDMAGVEIELPNKVESVICTSQNAMEFMVVLEQSDKLVGVHKSIKHHTWSKEFIENLDDIETYGYKTAPEAVFESGADLVIVKDAAAAEELRNSGVIAITFNYRNSKEMLQAVEMLAEIFGDEAKKKAEKWTEYYKNTVEEVTVAVSDIAENEKKNVYFMDASTSIDEGGLTSTVGGDHIVAEWFDIINANFVTDEFTNITSINEEKILEIDPETIIISGWCENTRKEQLMADENWVNVTAVRNKDIYIMPIGYVSFERYAVEAPLLLKYSASQLYPSEYSYNAIEDFKVFFNEFYGNDVSEEKIKYMLDGLSPDGTRMD